MRKRTDAMKAQNEQDRKELKMWEEKNEQLDKELKMWDDGLEELNQRDDATNRQKELLAVLEAEAEKLAAKRKETARLAAEARAAVSDNMWERIYEVAEHRFAVAAAETVEPLPLEQLMIRLDDTFPKHERDVIFKMLALYDDYLEKGGWNGLPAIPWMTLTNASLRRNKSVVNAVFAKKERRRSEGRT